MKLKNHVSVRRWMPASALVAGLLIGAALPACASPDEDEYAADENAVEVSEVSLPTQAEARATASAQINSGNADEEFAKLEAELEDQEQDQ
jgi:hypothetical protein